MALVLRIKFPPTYPLIYKTLRIDANLTVHEAVLFIAQTLNIPAENNIGLYLPDEKRWLDDNATLASYESLQDVVRELLFLAVLFFCISPFFSSARFLAFSTLLFNHICCISLCAVASEFMNDDNLSSFFCVSLHRLAWYAHKRISYVSRSIEYAPKWWNISIIRFLLLFGFITPKFHFWNSTFVASRPFISSYISSSSFCCFRNT